MFETRNSVVFLVLLGIFALQSLSAQSTGVQPKSNSPYSRFGMGDPASLPFAGQNAMGGLGAAYNDPYFMNMVNPAALGYLNTTDLEIGFFARFNRLNDGNTSTNLWNGNLNYLALGFPLLNPINRTMDKKSSKVGLGMGFILQPFTTVGYDVRTEQELPEVGKASSTFRGSGGSYRLMWGNGFRYHRFSAGVNLGYLFGKTSFDRTVEFTEVGPNAYFTNYLDEQSLNGFLWNAGAQFSVPLQKKPEAGGRTIKEKNLIIGVYGNSATSFQTNDSRFHVRENRIYNDLDTILLQTDTRNTGTLPGEYAIGITYDQSDKLKLGIEYGAAFWSKYRNPLRQEALSDTRRFAAGLEYIPNASSYNNYWQRVRYRAGAFYRSDPRTINGDQLKEFGVSLGFGMPLILPRQQTSFVNFTVEGGRFGSAEAIRETYVRMTLGFTLNDNSWFFKRKFN